MTRLVRDRPRPPSTGRVPTPTPVPRLPSLTSPSPLTGNDDSSRTSTTVPYSLRCNRLTGLGSRRVPPPRTPTFRSPVSRTCIDPDPDYTPLPVGSPFGGGALGGRMTCGGRGTHTHVLEPRKATSFTGMNQWQGQSGTPRGRVSGYEGTGCWKRTPSRRSCRLRTLTMAETGSERGPRHLPCHQGVSRPPRGVRGKRTGVPPRRTPKCRPSSKHE